MADHPVPASGPLPVERRAYSPCVGYCRMDASGIYCDGCLRTLDEIAAWSTATEEQRWAILRAVDERRVARDQS